MLRILAWRLIPLACTAVGLQHSALAQVSDSAVSVARLVSAMKADQADLTKIRVAAEWSVRDGKSSQKQLDCIKSFPSDSFTPIFLRTFQDSLTPAEIEDAAAFFEGPHGQKFIARRFAMAYSVPGVESAASAPAYIEDDLRELRAAAKKSWGEKLLRGTIERQPAHQKAVTEKTAQLLASCEGR